MKASETLAGSRIASQAELYRKLHPHPRVTAVEKKSQPPRRLPSPATERARDLKRALTKQGQPLYPRARNLQTALEQGHQNYIFASGLASSAVSGKLLLALRARLIDGFARRNGSTRKLDAQVYRHDLIATMASIDPFERGHVRVVTSNGDANMAFVCAASMGRVESRPTRIWQPGFKPRVTCLVCRRCRVARCYRWSKVA